MKKIEERLAASTNEYTEKTPKGPLPKIATSTRKIKPESHNHFDYLYGRVGKSK